MLEGPVGDVNVPGEPVVAWKLEDRPLSTRVTDPDAVATGVFVDTSTGVEAVLMRLVGSA